MNLLRRLASPRLAAWLIAVLIGMSFFSVVLPQKSYMGNLFEDFARDVPWLVNAMTALSLDRLFSGWPIAVVAGLLTLNVAACTILRLRNRRRVVSQVAVGRSAPSARLTGVPDATFLGAAEEILVQAGYRILVRAEGGVVGRAGGSGFWGSMLLHVSLLIMIIGGIATSLTSFRGELYITEGQTIIDSAAAYSDAPTEPEYGPAYTGARISLDSMDMTYDGPVVVKAVAVMRGLEQSGRMINQDVSVNHPLDVSGKSYLIQQSGYAASLIVGTSEGDSQALVINLAERRPEGWHDYIDLGVVDGEPMVVEMTAQPVPLEQGQPLPDTEFELDDPRLRVRVIRGEQTVWQGVLARGDAVPPEAGITLVFEDVRIWNRYLVRAAPARWISYVGFWMAVLGSAWRFAVPERRISVAVRRDDGSSVALVSHRARPWSGLHAASDAALVDRILELAHVAPERISVAITRASEGDKNEQA